ncbi:eukaryotic translation initiation factor subunit eIF2B-gamma [Cladophialophora carrionii]|uniref:Translation initiation factor eIF2B subunit gamma n=1 Tax=Cladophialophora carrionii TaxID=86049 RepID=A0A1C1CMU6_9EURO|nr:eukaryotic translation initiation factor subunit eIF2B-gamma [Cladophialophora carrionii]
MQARFSSEGETSISRLGDVDGIGLLADETQRNQATDSAGTSLTRNSLNPRIQFLRLSAVVRGRQGTLGATPPYQPVPPSLHRQLDVDGDPTEDRTDTRTPSPLRNLALSNCYYGHDSQHRHITASPTFHTQPSNPVRRAIKMPQTGFQALILCGPGIGLNTFTSVPAEFPKALVEVANRPMVWYVLDWCYRMGVTDITLVTPPTSKDTIAAALAQNPYLTSLPSPSADLLAPASLEYTTPTAELLRLPEVQEVIKSDFLLLPCDLICGIPGDQFLETYFTRVGGPGGIGASSGLESDTSRTELLSLGGEKRGRRGGLSIWYNTVDREESVKGEECDFMCTTKLDSEHNLPLAKTASLQSQGVLRKLVWAMPMSELWDQVEEDKSFKIRQSLLRKHGAIKCMTRYRDSHIYFFPYWVKDFAKLNEDFESVSEDLVGTWAKVEWRKPSYRARFGARKIFAPPPRLENGNVHAHERPIEEEIDLLSLSSTHVTEHPAPESLTAPRIARLASRVHTDVEDRTLSPQDDNTQAALIEDSGPVPLVPPILSYILPSAPDAPLVRRVDSTPLLLSVTLSLAKLPSLEEHSAAGSRSAASPFAHAAKIHATATIAPRVTISRSDTLIDSNSTIATQCVIKNSVIGASVSIGTGTRITGCVIMDGATIGDKCVLTGTVVGKKSKVGNKSSLTNCEVQDGNVVADGTEGKGEKYLVGGLEDEMEEGEEMGFDDGGEDEGSAAD